MAILITGGAGYIGSHTCVQLLDAGYDVIVFDNLSNASPKALQRVEKITGKSIPFIHGDIRKQEDLKNVFEHYKIEAVIHFAGLKVVEESINHPLKYYENNIHGTAVLCEVMQTYGCRSIIFSSTAAVYGSLSTIPIKENSPLHATNPYGHTKIYTETMLRDLYASNNSWKIVLLRYFNPVGAHPSGLIGEDPNSIPNNLMPFISQVAIGRREYLSVFGNDYDTIDGTGVRDYIHVVDLANGHLKAMEKLHTLNSVLTVNLGTGKGYSVLEMVKAFEKASGKHIPYKIAPRRSGDIAVNYADPSYAKKILGWEATRNIEDMCQDTWRWQSKNPNGYEG